MIEKSQTRIPVKLHRKVALVQTEDALLAEEVLAHKKLAQDIVGRLSDRVLLIRPGRVEAVVFASAQPVLRENLAEVVGKACNLDLIFDEIKDKLRGRPYEIVAAAGVWSFRTKLGFDAAIRLRSAAHRRAN